MTNTILWALIALANSSSSQGWAAPDAMQPNPFQAFIDTLMLPIDLVTYPARRDTESDYRHDAVRHRDW